jgi:hypothetical protein
MPRRLQLLDFVSIVTIKRVRGSKIVSAASSREHGWAEDGDGGDEHDGETNEHGDLLKNELVIASRWLGLCAGPHAPGNGVGHSVPRSDPVGGLRCRSAERARLG